LGTMDSTSLKMKVAASIVAISSIHLLRVFMDARNIETEYLMWYVIIHMTFVVSAFAMVYLDKLTKHCRLACVRTRTRAAKALGAVVVCWPFFGSGCSEATVNVAFAGTPTAEQCYVRSKSVDRRNSR